MSMRSIVLGLSLLIAAPLAADEVRLKDGRVVVGSVKVRGNLLEISTREGIVRVDRKDVLRIRDEGELREALSDLASQVPNTGFGRLELARIASSWGLGPELWAHLDVAVQLDDKSKRLKDFLATLEPEVLKRRYRNRPTQSRVREMLRQVRPDQPAKAAAVEELLVREPDADEALRNRARRSTTPERRLVAVAALARRGLEGSDLFVYRSAILDSSKDVRRGAMKLAQLHGDSSKAVQYLTAGLLHSNPLVRIRTAEAFANLEDPSAVLVLVEAGPNAGLLPQAAGGGPRGTRAYMAITQQTAYIRDFDVEVAQASFIANPVVDVIQSGVVLDVTVAAVVTHRIRIINAYRSALRTLVGSDPGANPSRWTDWLGEFPRGDGR